MGVETSKPCASAVLEGVHVAMGGLHVACGYSGITFG
jgi:hypothetical protein